MADGDLDTPTWVTRAASGASTLRVRRCRLEVVAGPDAGLRREVETTTMLRAVPSGPRSEARNSCTSRPRSPIRPMTTTSALQ